MLSCQRKYQHITWAIHANRPFGVDSHFIGKVHSLMLQRLGEILKDIGIGQVSIVTKIVRAERVGSRLAFETTTVYSSAWKKTCVGLKLYCWQVSKIPHLILLHDDRELVSHSGKNT